MRHPIAAAVIAAAAFAAPALEARADAVIDWNVRANEVVVESKIGTLPAMRVMAIVHAAMLEAVASARPGPAPGAAVAAASRGRGTKLLPAQQASIERAYQTALDSVADGPAKTAGIAAGERAAAQVLAMRADDGAATPSPYRPHTTAPAYVPTPSPAAPQWGSRKPWLMKTASQFRPGPPPALSSGVWVRDYNEVKRFGGKASNARSAEQTEIAHFWEYSLPPIYHGIVRSVAVLPGRSVEENARFFAAATQALDDALIATFDAKYHYNFWRPVTAVRNGDRDGNPATDADTAWTPLHDAPLHPEYPSFPGGVAGALGAVLDAELAGTRMVLSTTSPSAKNIQRRWTSVADMVQEVADARIYEGIHYRTSVEVGTALGRQIGELAAERFMLSNY